MTGGRDADVRIPGLAALLARQHGLARRPQLRDLGITDKHVQRQIDAGRWQLVAPEVVSTDNGRLDLWQLRWRAVLHAPASWLGGRSSLQVLGLRGLEPPRVHVLVPRGARPVPLEGVVIHVSDRLVGLDRRRAAGIPLAPAPRAAIDGGAWSPHPRLAAGLVVDVVRQGLATVDGIDAELAVAGRVRHKVAMREALHGARDGAESVAEIDLGPLLLRAGITTFRRQVRVGRRRHDVEATLTDGTILIIEVDGEAHESAERRWADAARDMEAAADGKITVRVPAFAVRYDDVAVVSRLRGIAAAAQRRANRPSMCVQSPL
jgi:very-short-patch-repair endonuclease